MVTIHACDRRTDRILLAIPRLHYMQCGKNDIGHMLIGLTRIGRHNDVNLLCQQSAHVLPPRTDRFLALQRLNALRRNAGKEESTGGDNGSN